MSCILVTWQVINGFRIRWFDLLYKFTIVITINYIILRILFETRYTCLNDVCLSKATLIHFLLHCWNTELLNWRPKVKVTLRLTVSPSVSLGVEPHLVLSQSVSKSWCRAPSGAHDQIFTTVLTVTFLFFVGCPLWREDGSVFCICCWPLPAQSFSAPSPLVLATIFYCLRFETSLFVASYDTQVHGGGNFENPVWANSC
jgi:hypothetical protein